MILAYYYLLAIVLQISRTASQKKHVYFQIDEFIKQLMVSEKFEELADLIANKAAQKIKNMDSQDNDHGKNALRILDEEERIEPKPEAKSSKEQEQTKEKYFQSDEKSIYKQEKKKHKEPAIDEKPNNKHDTNKDEDLKLDGEKKNNYHREGNKGKDSRPREKSSSGHDKQKSKTSRSSEKLGNDRKNSDSNSKKKIESINKIDTQTFLKNHMASKDLDLELNFEHLKGELEKHRYDIKGNNIKSHKSFDKNKHKEHNENNRAVDKHDDDKENNENASVKSELKNDDSKELHISDGSNENKAHEQDTYHNNESDKKRSQNSIENKSTNDSGAGNDKKRNKEFNYDRNSNEKPIPRIKKRNETEEDSKSSEAIEKAKAFIDKVMDKVSQELNNPSFSSKEVLVGINGSHSDESEKKLGTQRKSGNKIFKKNSRRNSPFINETDGKLSSLRTSVEYDEYNSAKPMEKKYINT